jgi:hypothetical protein
MSELIRKTFARRNFDVDPTKVAKYDIKVGEDLLTNKSPGSRYNPVKLTMGNDEFMDYDISATINDGEVAQYKYPVTVRSVELGYLYR